MKQNAKSRLWVLRVSLFVCLPAFFFFFNSDFIALKEIEGRKTDFGILLQCLLRKGKKNVSRYNSPGNITAYSGMKALNIWLEGQTPKQKRSFFS